MKKFKISLRIGSLAAALLLSFISSSCTKNEEIAIVKPSTNIFCKCPSCIKITAKVSDSVSLSDEVSARWDKDYMRGSGQSSLRCFSEK